MPKLLENIVSPHTLLTPLYADIQPMAPLGRIAGAIESRLPILRGRKAEGIVILLDRETRGECPGELANALVNKLHAACNGIGVQHISVVVKNTCFENWLVSDPGAIGQLKARFRNAESVKRAVAGKADTVDACTLLKRAAIGDAYDKVADAVRILSKAEPLEMAVNSRSFRRFLRTVDHPQYVAQSRLPVP